VVLLLVQRFESGFDERAVTRPLAAKLDRLRLGEPFRLVADQRFGNSSCLGGDCPRLSRYYVTDLTPVAACAAASTALSSWISVVTPQPDSGTAACVFAGPSDGDYVNAQVRADMTIEPEADEIGDRPITEPHRAVLLVEVVRPG
jgi:hypothetical protein